MKQIIRFVVAALCLLPLLSSAQDVGISTIESPVSCGSRDMRVKVKIKNFSGTSVGNIPVTVMVTGSGSANVSGTYTKTIAANGTDTFSLATGINSASGGSYTIKTYTSLSSDANKGNDTLTKVFGLNAIPTAAFSKNISTICRGKSVTFINSSTGASSYKWYFGEGSTSLANNPTHTFTKAGTHTVSLVAMNSSGCRDSVTSTVTVLPNPGGSNILEGTPFQGYFYTGTPNDPDLTCVGDILTYEIKTPPGFNNTDYGNTWQISYTIKSTSGANAGNNTFAAPTSGRDAFVTFNPSLSNADLTYVLTVIVTNKSTGCDSVMAHYISVNSSPTADFTHTGTCFGEPTMFKDASTIPPGLVVRRYEFGEGTAFSSTANPTYTYKSTGTFTVTYTVTSKGGCDDVITKQVTINPRPVADFESPATICVGNPAQFIDKSMSTGGNITSWKWTIVENGVTKTFTDTNKTYTFTQPGTHSVSLEVSTGGGCISTYSKNVTVVTGPTASFPQPVGCVNEDITFTSTSINASNYIWAFSDRDTLYGATVKRKFLYNSSYSVQLIAISDQGCSDIATKPVKFNPQPGVKFTNSNLCAGKPVTFTDASTVAEGGSRVAWLWKFDDGTKYTTSTMTKTFATPGQKRLTFVVTTDKGCKDSIIQFIDVKASPAAAFDAPAKSCINVPVIFKSNSTGATSFEWDFSDGNTSTERDPMHTYTDPGSYKVMLRTTNSSGCTDSMVRTVQVGEGPEVNFVWCAKGKAVTFAPSDSSLATYDWDFGDILGGASDKRNPTYTFLAQDGQYDVTLTVTDALGCENSYTTKVGTGKHENSNNCQVGIETMDASRIGLQVYPNPFSNKATIAYSLEKATTVSINLYDATGKEAAWLINETQGAGDHQLQVDGTAHNLKPGIYLIRITMDGANYYSNLIYKN